MALPKLFERIFWHNNTTPAINEDNLNAMSKAIDDIDDRVILIGDDVVTVIPQIRAYLEQAEDLAEVMEQLSKNPPYIGANGNWYVWDTNTEDFVDSGIDASITVSIADINLLPVGSTPYVTNTGTSTDPIFHLYIPQTKSITNVVKDGQYDDPLRDKYNIIFNDGTHTSFLVTNGVGIVSITKTSTQGLVDTYTISCSDRTEYDFTVTNGATGNGIASITKTGTQGLVDTYTITMTDGTPSTFTVTNGESGSADKMDKVNPTGSGAVSIGRRGGSTVGETSVAMGRNVVAGGTGAVAVGVGTEASSFYTFAGGFQSKAQDSGAFAYGIGSISDKRCKAVFGTYNNNRNNTVFEIGNGTSDSARSNIFEIYNDGKISTDNGTTKHDLTSLGDMLESTYDSDGAVKNGGGIKAWVQTWVQSLGYITGLAWSALTGKPFSTVGAGLYVNNGTLKAICENFGVGNRGTASASEVREQYVRLNDATYRIDRTIYMQYSQTLSTTTDTVYTFNHGLISANGVIEVFTDIFGINPSNIVTTNGQCVVTFPKQSTAQTMTCRIYISME